jgi:hypothetical protein
VKERGLGRADSAFNNKADEPNDDQSMGIATLNPSYEISAAALHGGLSRQ